MQLVPLFLHFPCDAASFCNIVIYDRFELSRESKLRLHGRQMIEQQKKRQKPAAAALLYWILLFFWGSCCCCCRGIISECDDCKIRCFNQRNIVQILELFLTIEVFIGQNASSLLNRQNKLLICGEFNSPHQTCKVGWQKQKNR